MQPERLGPYKIGKKIGRGGMGTVFSAVNTVTGQPAAIKLLNPHLADEEGFRERFELEIETLKKLKHPNIVRLFGFGEEDDQLYYAMELVEGTNVEDELQAGRRFDWRETTRLGIKLCRALKHAHDHGVVHRDLKPANLLLTPDGDIKLTDFGIARLFGNTRLTSDGGVIGTAEYMAPEQVDGRPVSNLADLYSLGGVLFAMLAGRPPFRGKSLPEMLQMQRHSDPPPVSRFAADVPQELERTIARLLSKEPRDRGPNADLVARQLAAMEHGLSLSRALKQDEPESGDAGFSFPSARTVSENAEIAYDPDAPTRVAEPSIVPPPLTPGGPTQAFDPQTVGGAPLPETGPLAPAVEPTSKFVTIEEDEARREAERRRDRGPVAAQIAVLALCLVGLFGLGWYLMRPPTADALYDRIQASAADERPERLVDAADDIEQFLARFGDDPRCPGLQKYQEEIELARLEKKFSGRSRLLSRDETLSPLERDYLQAMALLTASPDRAAAALDAILAVYAPVDVAPADDRLVLELCRRQSQRLHKQIDAQTAARRQAIERSLANAARLHPSNPTQAKQTWQAIVTLYADKPWAADLVEQARQRAAQSP